MADHYLIPRRLSRAFPSLKKIAGKIEAWLLISIFLLLGKLPIPLSGRLSSWLFKTFAGFTSRFRTARKNLRLAFPDKTEQEIKLLSQETFHSLGLALSELLHMMTVWEQRDQRLEFSVAQESVEVLGGEQPIVFVTAHTQAWQFTNFVAASLICVSLSSMHRSPTPTSENSFLNYVTPFPHAWYLVMAVSEHWHANSRMAIPLAWP